MIEWFALKEGRLATVDDTSQAEVIRLVRPDEHEVRAVSELTGAPIDFLTAATDRDERPRIEVDGDAKLIIVRVPYEESDSDVPIMTAAFGLVLTPSHIVSVCSLPAPVWDAVRRWRGRLPAPTSRVMFLCALFMAIARLYLIHLHKIHSEADTVEREIHHSMRNEMLIRMLNLEKCLVYFTTSLRAHEHLWDRFKKIHGRELTEEENDALEDVRIEFRQAQELADIHSNILSGMMDAFASVISNNLNVVLKFLTAVTIILMLPTLIASIYGMNVPLPFQHSPHAFLITMGLSVLLSVIGVIVFLRMKFF